MPMLKESNIELLVKAINSTENLNGEEFNKHPDALNAYIQMFGKDKYEEVVNSKRYAVYNKFYSPEWCFEKEIENKGIPSIEVKDYIDKIIPQPRKNYMLIYLIKLALGRNELNLALSFIDSLSEEDFEIKYVGHRQILNYHAENSNLTEFKKYLKLSKPGKSPRNNITISKSKFISNYSRVNGIDKGIELLNSKIFGWKYCNSIIENVAHKLTLKRINEILDQYPEFEEQDQFIRQCFYVHHFANQKPTTISKNEFHVLIEEVMKIDKSIKSGDGRLRDYWLYDIGSTVEDFEQIKVCKRNIISPFYKRELNYQIKNIKEKTMGNK